MKQILFIPQIQKIEEKQSLFILQIGQIEAKRSLFIPQIWKKEAERSLFIPQIEQIEAKRSGANWAYSRNRQDRSEINELDQSKTNRGGIFKTFMVLRNRFQGIVAWARICKRLRSLGINSKEPIPLANVAWARICKCLRSPGINSKELISPAYALAGLYNNPIPARFLAPLDCSKAP